MEDINNILSKKVGNNEIKRNTLEPKPVKIASVIIQTKKHDGTDMKIPMLNFLVKHPDRDEVLKINKLKFLENDKAVVRAFWVQLDEDGSFYKGSSVDKILKILGCESLQDTYGKDIDTVKESDNSSYLCLKAY